MGAVWPGFQLWMGLSGDKPGVGRNLDHLHDPSVRGKSGKLHAMGGQVIPEIIVDLIAMAVPFLDLICPVQFICLGSFVQDTRISAEPQSSADVLNANLIRHDVDDWVQGIRLQLSAVGIVVPTTLRANSMIATCIPRQSPRKGML